MSYRFKDYDLKDVNGSITKIRYGVLSEEEIVSLSVVDITQMNSYGADEPVTGGLFDRRMGVVDKKSVCKVCHQKELCPGHPGKIDLEFPVFLYQFFGLTKTVLQCICQQCSKAYIDPNKCNELKRCLKREDIGYREKHKYVQQLNKNLSKKCGDYNEGGCGLEKPLKIVLDQLSKVILTYKNQPQSILNAQQVRNIFLKLTDEQIRNIGICPEQVRPKDLIATKLLVQSPHIRPAIKSDNGSRSQDDLTSKLIDIVKANKDVKKFIELKCEGRENFENQFVNQKNQDPPLPIQSLQHNIATMIDNNIPQQTKNVNRSGKAIKSVEQRLDQKRGRVRDNLMGKRVDFSGRSVITPGASLNINQLGVPLKVAMTLAIPQWVNRYNIERYQEMMKNDQYPGIECYSNQGTNYIKLRGNPNRGKIKLKIGDIVYKHLENGDWVIFNRQPSLHKPSLMCHQIVIVPENSFVLAVGATPAYNADYDGDEMNLHAPVSKLTESEIKLISNVNNQIIAQKTSSPIIGLVQDSIIGAYILTKKKTKYNLLQTMNLLQLNNQIQCRLPSEELREYTGKEILSTVLPPQTYLYKKIDQLFSKDEEENIVIERGKIKSGIFTKQVYQSMTNSLIHQTYNYGGPTVAANLINNTTRLAHQALLQEGFSMGIKDIIIEEENYKKIQNIIQKKKQQVKEITDSVLNGVFLNEARKTPQEYLEIKIYQILNNNEEIEKILIDQNKNSENQLLKMVESGSKGKKENIMQIQGMLSQQEIEGKRAQPGYIGRTLPHFKKYDYGPESRGYVENSFVTGLTPTEYFFHSCAGRVGLCDTAVKSITWETKIIIIENDKSKQVKIGNWIDKHLEKSKDKIQYYPKDKNMELLNIQNDVFIPTADSHGNSSWAKLTAVTRHDPSETIYKIKTRSGRYVTVAESKTLLIWNQEKKQFFGINSKDVKIGNQVPIIENLKIPPVIQEYVDMEQYFPKDIYVWGIEFNKAQKIMNDTMQNRFHIPKGWWRQHNGTSFTTPYTKKASLKRATSGKSGIDNIKSGFIYSATKQQSLMPDKFVLNKENGIFIGLFLSEGNVDKKRVSIANIDQNVKNFVKKWFDNNKITNSEYTRYVRIGTTHGTTSSIQGFSTLLARFLDFFVGHDSHNKYVPDVAFVAPEEFIIGLLNGYIAGNGSVMEYGIEISSVSQRLTEGIATLCNRVGVFGYTSVKQNNSKTQKKTQYAPSYVLTILNHWAKKLSEKLDCLINYKNFNLKSIKYSSKHVIYPTHNDVVLDSITKIEMISSKNYPKLYDVTVPTTFNFMLANGLTLLDTAQTGYISRRLVKAQEDLKTEYDCSVTNANNKIIQIFYGNHGFSCDALEQHELTYQNMPLKQLKEQYLITASYKQFNLKKNQLSKLKQYYEQIEKDSEFVGQYINAEGNIKYAVNFKYLLQYYKPNKSEGLDPIYILEKIDQIMNEFMDGKYQKQNKLLGIILRYYLNPKFLSKTYNKKRFDDLLKAIMIKLYQSLCQPKENVGVIGAQSLGETSSQLVLNSFHLSGASSASEITRGLPRISEILVFQDQIKSPFCHIYLKNHMEATKEQYQYLKNQIQLIYLKDLILESNIGYNEEFQNEFNQQYNIKTFSQVPSAPYLLNFKFDRVLMGEYDIKMIDIKQNIIDKYDETLYIQGSDDNDDVLELNIKPNKKDPQDDDFLFLKNILEDLTDKFVLRGIKDINKAVVIRIPEKEARHYNKEKRSIISPTMYRIETQGSNLQDILQNQNIDHSKLYTNNLIDAYKTYGIEYTKNLFIKELYEAFTQSGNIAIEHIDLLACWCTHKGYPLPVNRYGINSQVESGVLHKASFEETPKNLIQGALNAEEDDLNGTTAPLILGQTPKQYGTSSCKIYFDVENLFHKK